MTKRKLKLRSKQVRAPKRRDAPAPRAVISLPQLAALLDTTEQEALELGRAASLHFLFGGKADFHIGAGDLSIWLGAARRHGNRPDGDNP